MEQRSAIITAASRGMGAACARELAAQGYTLVLMSSTDAVTAIAQELDAKAFVGSVTNPDDLQQLVSLALNSFGRIDVVVNNTGHPARGDLLELTDLDWLAGFDMVFFNVVRLARMVTPMMEKQGKGSIVNITTLGALEPNLSFPISSSLRAGLAAFTKLFADRYAGAGIRMNNVLPGFVDSYPVSDAIRETIPMKREATVEEIAKTVAFLASDDSAYITGQNIRVDGGQGRSL
jgi:NAD(P)-dependent dehydrogenase (short-subunit alcohol dehydrogenase family)